MSRDLLVSQALSKTQTFSNFAQGHQVEAFELFDSWVETFMGIFKSSKASTW